MNKRIKYLLNSARLFCYDDDTVSLMGEQYAGQPEIEEFARLLILECANVCETATSQRTHGNIHEVSLEYSKRIKQHFEIDQECEPKETE